MGEARVADAAASTTASITTAGDLEQQKKRRTSGRHSTLTLEPSQAKYRETKQLTGRLSLPSLSGAGEGIGEEGEATDRSWEQGDRLSPLLPTVARGKGKGTEKCGVQLENWVWENQFEPELFLRPMPLAFDFSIKSCLISWERLMTSFLNGKEKDSACLMNRGI